MDMTIENITAIAKEYTDSSPLNYVTAELAIRPDLVGFKIFDAPIFAIGSAADPLFMDFKKPDIIGPESWLPTEWLPSALSVISFFFPITERGRRANAGTDGHPADEWLYSPLEGQALIHQFALWLGKQFIDAGYEAIAPSQNERFRSSLMNNSGTDEESKSPERHTSNWSERHVAYACGLGTFGLSKGLISPKGIAGRYGSIIVSAPLKVTPRPYTGVYDYCIQCGECAKRCPGKAIDLSRGMHEGKDHRACSKFLLYISNKYTPRYGCGQCQVGVPCEDRIPMKTH